jgi:hypothetical protein
LKFVKMPTAECVVETREDAHGRMRC